MSFVLSQWQPSTVTGSALLAVFVTGASVFLTTVLALAWSPDLQRALMYLHWFRLPFLTYWLPLDEVTRADLLNLRLFRLAHFSRAVEISTSDGVILQAWHLTPTRHAPAIVSAISSSDFTKEQSQAREKLFDTLLANPSEPVTLFLHGQAATRGVVNRMELARCIAAELQGHVLLIDYRGFGGSTGSPTQSGLVEDALSAWRWVRARRPHGPIYVYGQSLGSAVAIQLVAALEAGGTDSPEGLVLDVPFLSAPAAALHHPLYRPLTLLPPLRRLLERSLVDKWENHELIGRLRCRLLVFGAGRDRVVGPHSPVQLFEIVRKVTELEPDRRPKPQLVVVPEALHSNIYSYNEWLLNMATFLCPKTASTAE